MWKEREINENMSCKSLYEEIPKKHLGVREQRGKKWTIVFEFNRSRKGTQPRLRTEDESEEQMKRPHMHAPANGLTSGKEYFQDLESTKDQHWSPTIANITYNHYPQAGLTGDKRKHHKQSILYQFSRSLSSRMNKVTFISNRK